MLRPRLRTPARPRLSMPIRSPLVLQTRWNHVLRQLELREQWDPVKKGIPDFLSPVSFQISWTQYQTHLLETLNQMTVDKDWAQKPVKDILLASARDPSMAGLFNHASMIHNNHFFFKHLSPKTVHMPKSLENMLEDSFGSIETLRRELVYTAAAMFGPGFVWLVKTTALGKDAEFKVLTTYAAGSPYPAAHWRRQDVDLNTDANGFDAQGIPAAKAYLENSAYGAGKRSSAAAAAAAAKRASFAPGGVNLQPVLCINTWQHVWLWDYGFGVGGAGGKLAYAEAWWKRIDWELVFKEATIEIKKMSA